MSVVNRSGDGTSTHKRKISLTGPSFSDWSPFAVVGEVWGRVIHVESSMSPDVWTGEPLFLSHQYLW